MLRLVKAGKVEMHGRMDGPKLTVEQLLDLEVDDVVTFDRPIHSAQQLTVNNFLKYQGQIVTIGQNRAFEVQERYRANG